MLKERKWQRRSRQWRKLYRRLSQHWVDAINQLAEREAAALNKADEYRRQGNEAIREVTDQRDDLLAWQRRVQVAAAHYKKAHLPNWCAPLEDLYRAIESDAKEET